MLYTFFFLMLGAFVAALIVLPLATAPYVPWWGTILIVAAELVFLRYALFRILGLMFAAFVSVGLRVGVQGMRGAKVDIHSLTVVPRPGPEMIVRPESGSVDDDVDDVDEDEDAEEKAAAEREAAEMRYVKLDCTVSPSAKAEASNWPVKHYDAGSFKLSSEGFAWPSFPPKDDETRTGEIVAAALVDGANTTPVALDKQLLGRQRLSLIFKCPPTLRGSAKLKFIVLTLARVEVP